MLKAILTTVYLSLYLNRKTPVISLYTGGNQDMEKLTAQGLIGRKEESRIQRQFDPNSLSSHSMSDIGDSSLMAKSAHSLLF